MSDENEAVLSLQERRSESRRTKGERRAGEVSQEELVRELLRREREINDQRYGELSRRLDAAINRGMWFVILVAALAFCILAAVVARVPVDVLSNLFRAVVP